MYWTEFCDPPKKKKNPSIEIPRVLSLGSRALGGDYILRVGLGPLKKAMESYLVSSWLFRHMRIQYHDAVPQQTVAGSE